MIQTKVAQNYISYKKLSGIIFLSTSGVELGSSKDVPYLKCCKTLEWERSFTSGLNAVKNTDNIKNGSNESCAKLNFLRKTLPKHTSIYTTSGAKKLQRCPIFEML